MKPILNIFIFIFRQMQLSSHRQTTKSTNSTNCTKFERLSTLSTFSIVDSQRESRHGSFPDVSRAGSSHLAFSLVKICLLGG